MRKTISYDLSKTKEIPEKCASAPVEQQLLEMEKCMMDCSMCYPSKGCRLHHP